MKRYKQAVLPIALRVALFFPGVSTDATAASPCGTPNTTTTIHDTQTEPCNLSNGENLTIKKRVSIKVPTEPSYDSGNYALKYSAVNIGNDSNQASLISVDNINNNGELLGAKGVTVTATGSVGELLNNGTMSGGSTAIWVSGEIEKLDNYGIIKSIVDTDAINSIAIYQASGRYTDNKYGRVGKITNHEMGSIDGITVNTATLTTLDNYGTLKSLADIVGSAGATIEVSNNGGNISNINNYGTVCGPNHGILIQGGGHLGNLNNFSVSKGIMAVQDAIQVSGQDISGLLPKSSRINQITNESRIHGKRNGIHIDNKGTVDTITNSDAGVIQGDHFSILNNGTITDGIHNAGTINGNVELGSAILYVSGSKAILNGNVTGSKAILNGNVTKLKDSVVTIGNNGSTVENLDFTFTHNMNVGIVKILSGNTLRLGDGHNTGSVSNDIDNEGHLYFNPSDKSAYNHAIRGKGTVHQTGSGTTILTGSNIYTGETNIESGTLQLGHNGRTGSIDNTAKVIIGQKGILAFDRSDKVMFDRHIEGVGSLRQQGSGDLILTGNVATGKPITVTSGKLWFGDGTTIGKLSLAGIENQGAVIVAGADDSTVTLDGEINGTGTLDIMGGKAVLTGDSTYSGQTTIGQGATLQLGNGGSVGNLTQSNIFNSGMLAFNHSNNKMTYSNAISGSGSVAQTGTRGTTILNGQNTYTGVTSVKAGTLQFDSWTNMPQTRLVDVKSEGTLALNLKGTNRFDGVISGSGLIKKIGTGLTTFSADSVNFTGSTHVETGTLVVDGQLNTSMLRVQSEGTVAGVGTIGAIGSTATIENGGRLIGHQDNTLTFGNDLIFSNGANVDISLGAENISVPTLFDVKGNLTLAGTLDVTDLGGFSVGEYDIFNYGGKLNYDSKLPDYGMTLLTGGKPGSLSLTHRNNKVYLINTGGIRLNYWDGDNASKHDNGVIDGGNGIWQVGGPDNWTLKEGKLTGERNTSWSNSDQFAIFSGTAGTVRVDDSGGNVTVNGMQFSTSGYTINGHPLTLKNDPKNSAKIRVGTGKKSATDMVATIESNLTGSATLETTDYGKLILKGENDYNGGTKITRGVLQIGDGSTKGSIAGNVAIGSEGTLIFNRSDDITFGGDITGTGKLVQNGTGTLTLTSANNHTGMAEVRRGTFRQGKEGAFSPASLYTIGRQGKLDTGGFSATISALNNSGRVLVGGDNKTVGRALTITGDYTGNNGTVTLSTILGGDNSKTDKFLVKGNTSGSTYLEIKNAGGNGAPTSEGIKIIDVEGKSDGTFTLSGAYSYKGDPAIVAGAYAYRLYKNGLDNSDGNWYLRSSLTTPSPKLEPTHLYQAGVSIYEIYGRVLQTLNAPESLHNRLYSGEDRLRSMNSFSTTVDDVDENSTDNIPSGVWGQITASHGKLSSRITTAGTGSITYNMTRAQVGVDKRLYNDGLGTVNGGIFLQYANINADAGSVHGDGNIHANGYTLGTTSTWHDNNGFYLDGLAQFSYFNSDLNSKTAGQYLGNKKSAFGYALSLESGRRIDLTPTWSLTPQTQLVYSSIDMKDFDDRFGTKIRFDQSNNMKLRVGATIDYSQKWYDEQNQDEKASNLYGLFNLRQELLGRNDVVDVANVSFHGGNERTWGEAGAGGSYSWGNGRYFAYSQTSVNTSLKNFADSYELSGKIGLRMTW
ncbi:autotransporter outer membrane beta-barrel domain-containing protein [Xenorhabdus bharatensis]|uniref:autotransporter outer membrane beta-barrel domain-containing protein n=1 Tax=Xenorhabdus bharatensis TaxID=3136256 RepID=UPI0030F37AF9